MHVCQLQGVCIVLRNRGVQVVDPRKASYGVEHATYAVVQLAQTTMRSELGKISLDKSFEERETLNRNIVRSIQCGPPRELGLPICLPVPAG